MKLQQQKNKPKSYIYTINKVVQNSIKLQDVQKKNYLLLFCSLQGFQKILKVGSVHFSTAQPVQNPVITI